VALHQSDSGLSDTWVRAALTGGHGSQCSAGGSATLLDRLGKSLPKWPFSSLISSEAIVRFIEGTGLDLPIRRRATGTPSAGHARRSIIAPGAYFHSNCVATFFPSRSS